MTPPPSYPPPGYPPPGYAPPPGYGIPLRPVPVAPGGAPLADFGTRLLAYLVDRLIVSAVVMIPTLVVVVLMINQFLDIVRQTPAGQLPNLSALVGLWLLLFATVVVFSVLVQYFYQVTYQSRTGQTVGKRVMNIKVVSATDGGPLDVPTARRRFLVEVGCSLLSPLAYLDGLWQLWDQPYRQCWHDKWARTVVVRVGTT